MKKKIIAISLLLVAVLITVTVLLCMPKYNYMVEFEEDFAVENGVAPEEMEYVIVLSEDGEYIMDAEWKIEPAGMLMALSIVDETGKDINTFSAHWIDMNSGVMELPAGTYTMTLTPITSAEQWKEYFAKLDTSDWDVPVEEGEEPEMEFVDGTFKFDFAFKLEKSGNLFGIVCMMGVVIGVVLCVILYAIAQKDNSMKQNYDERQELLRGRGAKYGLYTMMFLNLALFLLEAAGVCLPMSTGLALFFSVLIGGSVWAVYCIWKDAYFALNQKAGVFIGVFLVMGIINLIIGIDAFLDGVAIQNNQLTLRSMNLFCAIMILVICGALILKKVCKDREEE